MFIKFGPNVKGRDFCVGDCHGSFDRLLSFLNKIEFDENKDRLFCVGDTIDRGANSDQVLDWLSQPWFHSVRGNHEQMVIDACDPYNSAAEAVLFLNGGQWWFNQDHVKQKEIAFAFESLPFMIEVETPSGISFGIIHADVPFNDWNKAKERLYQEDEQVKNFMLWDRSRRQGTLVGDVEGVDYVLVGHTPVPEAGQENNIIRLDTGAVFLDKFEEFKKGFTIFNMTDFEFITERQL